MKIYPLLYSACSWAAKVWDGQQRNAIYDSVSVCKFITYAAGLDDLHELYLAATGFDTDRHEFDEAGRDLFVAQFLHI